MNCQQADKYIYEYCDARLSPELMREFEEHLLDCEECRDLVILTRMENEALLEALEMGTPLLDEQFTARLMAALPPAPKSAAADDMHMVKSARSWRPALYMAAVAAVVLLLTATVPGWFDNFKQDTQTNVSVNDNVQPQQRSVYSPPVDQNEKAANEAISIGSDQIYSDTAGNGAADYSADDGGIDYVEPLLDTDNNNIPQSNPHMQIAMADDAILEMATAKMQASDPMVKEAHLPGTTESPYRYRTYSLNLVKPVRDLQLIPTNLPEDYELKPNGTEKYIYTDKSGENTIEIAIKPYAITNDPLDAGVDEVMKGMAAPDSLPQHLEVITQYGENKYLVSLDSNLDHEVLLDLAGNIKLNSAP